MCNCSNDLNVAELCLDAVCKQAYDKLVAKIYSMNNPSHITTIMD